MIRTIGRGALVAIALVLAQCSAFAEDFPSRPIILIVGLAPGGITDVTARVYADAVSRLTSQPVVVENRPGAGGAIAASTVQNARPDGYTLLIFSGSQHATVAAASQAPYDPVKGFAPITFLFNSVLALSVPADSPAQTMEELHKIGRTKPGGLLFGTPGLGSPSHLLGARILLDQKVPAETIHYHGGGPMMPDLLTGRLDFSWPTLSLAHPFFADKRLRALAIDADTRSPMLPETPTLTELGYGKERVASWFGVAAPAGTPPELVDKLNGIFIAASRDDELKRQLDKNGTPIVTSTPAEMAQAMDQEWVAMQQLVKVLDIQIR
jgi:tripartite-type tricarboxylate transporter receptor subunit TctC